MTANSLEQYREAKSTVSKLEEPVKRDLIAKYYDLEAQLAQVKKELREEFGMRSIPRQRKGGRKKAETSQTRRDANPEIDKRIRKLASAVERQERKLSSLRSSNAPATKIRVADDELKVRTDELNLAREKASAAAN